MSALSSILQRREGKKVMMEVTWRRLGRRRNGEEDNGEED